MVFTQEDIDLMKEYAKKYGRDERIEKIEQSLIRDKDIRGIIHYAFNVKCADFDALQEVIIASQMPEAITSFAKACAINGHDCSAIEDGIIALGKAKYILDYAIEMKQLANIKKLQEAFIEVADPDIYATFAMRVNVADPNLFVDAIASCNDAGVIYDFANKFHDRIDVTKLQKHYEMIADPEELLLFAFIKGADLASIKNAIIESRDPESIYMFARDHQYVELGKKDIYDLQEALIETGDAKYIFFFAEDVKNSDFDALQKAVISTRDPHYITSFAIKRCADKKALEDAIIDIGDTYYIVTFAEYVDGADLDRLEDAVIASGDVQYVEKFLHDVKNADKKKLEDALEEMYNQSSKQNPTSLEDRMDDIIEKL